MAFDFNFRFATPGSLVDASAQPEQRRAPNRAFVRGDDPGDQQSPPSTPSAAPWPGPSVYTRIGGSPRSEPEYRAPERRAPRTIKIYPDSLRRGPA